MRRIALGSAAATLVSGLLTLPLATTGQAAPAAPAGRHPTAASRRSPSTTGPASPWTSPCCPTATSCTPPANGDDLAQRRQDRRQQPGRQHRRLPPRRGGPAEHRPRPGLRRQEEQLGLPLLLAAAEHPGRRPGHPGRQRGRRPVHRHRRPTSRRSRASSGSRASAQRRRRSTTRTEQQIIDVPVDRGICCHVGGDIVFDCAGNLLLSTGDDTNPFHSDGYTPIDERPDRNPAFDAQRSAANTNDLRGKVLRIKPKAGGGYTIPRRQPVPARAPPETRPEIYAMGLRNPFRIEVDPQTDDVYVADYSPDAERADPRPRPGRPRQVDRRSASPATTAGPTAPPPSCRTSTTTSPPATSGEEFDCAAPVNESPHNTGPARAAAGPAARRLVHLRRRRPSSPSSSTGGIGPMAGPAYDFDAARRRGPRPVAWPKYYDGMPLFYEWTRDYVKGIRAGRRRRARLDRGRHRPRSSPTTRWTWSSAPTARSTCSSTATATSPRTRTPSCPGSTTSAGRQPQPGAGGLGRRPPAGVHR